MCFAPDEGVSAPASAPRSNPPCCSRTMKVDYTYHYRKWNNDSPENRALAIRYYRRVLNGLLPANLGAKILDVGCGAGLLMLALRELGYTEVQGIDIDPGQVESCRSKGLDAVCAQD